MFDSNTINNQMNSLIDDYLQTLSVNNHLEVPFFDQVVTRNDLMSWFDISQRTMAKMAAEGWLPDEIGKDRPLDKGGRSPFVYNLTDVMKVWHQKCRSIPLLPNEPAITMLLENWLKARTSPNPPLVEYRNQLIEVKMERPLHITDAARRLGKTISFTKSMLNARIYSFGKGPLRVSAGDVVLASALVNDSNH